MRCGDRGPVRGDVVVGGRERAVGPADRAAGEPQALERLRAGHLVDEVQVDVEQTGRHLVVGPDLVEEGAHDRRSPADTTASRTASSFPWFSKWCGRSASKVTQSPVSQLVRRAVDEQRHGPFSTTVVSREPGSCIGGSPGPPVRGAGLYGVPGDLGALAGQRRREDLVGVAVRAALAALAGAHDRDGAVLVEAQQLGEPQLEAMRRSARRPAASGSSPRARPGESIGADTPLRSARSRRLSSIASRSARTRGPTETTSGSAAAAIRAYVITYTPRTCGCARAFGELRWVGRRRGRPGWPLRPSSVGLLAPHASNPTLSPRVGSYCSLAPVAPHSAPGVAGAGCLPLPYPAAVGGRGTVTAWTIPDRPDVLVLGAGGTLGEAWMRGLLAGLEAAGGPDMRACEYFVGTSAGSIVAATLAAGRPPRRG